MNITTMKTYIFILIQAIIFTGILGNVALAANVDTRVTQALSQTGHAKVILALNLPEVAPSRLRATKAAVARDPIGDTQESVLGSLPVGSYELTYQYSHVPSLAMTVTPESLAILKDHPQVKYIQFDEAEHIALADAVKLIEADQLWSLNPLSGITGDGVTVAVLDTGINTSHDYFKDVSTGDRIIAQTCSLVNNMATVKCPPSPTTATGTSAEDGLGHGTHVSGIVAKVAPGAKIAAVKVCNNNLTGGCQVSDSIAGLDWVIANHLTYDIKVVNMSIASSTLYSDSCDVEDPSRKSAIDKLIGFGITVFAAAGNDSNKTKMGAPACLSNTIAVGATYDANLTSSIMPCVTNVAKDSAACFSNSSLWLDILAPGSKITSSWIGSSSAESDKDGTSMASPMAAGVAALMLHKNSTLTPARIKAKLKKTGVNVTDTNNIIRPRIDALMAVNDTDTARPVIEMLSSGSYLINQGKFDFGWTTTDELVTKTITVKNAGTATLNLTFSSIIPSKFSLVGSFPTTINAGAQQSLQIKLDTTTVGDYTGTLQFTTNDPIAATIQLNLTGKVCTMQTVPFSENFESGAIPNCWKVTDNNLGDPPNWGVFPLGSELTPISGTYSAGVESNSSSFDNDDWLILPIITLSNKSLLQFNARNEAGNEKFEVRLSTSGNNPSDFVNLLATEIVTATASSADPPTHYSYSLNSYSGQNVYLAIRSISPMAKSSTLVVDDVLINVDNSPPNYQNGTPTWSNLTSTGFDLTVRLDEIGKAYYVVLPAATTAPTVTQVRNGQDSAGSTANVKAGGFIDVTTASSDFFKTISGLAANTDYKIYVVSEDISGNLQSAVTSISATTTKIVTPPVVIPPTPSIPPSYTVIERKDGTGSGQITSLYVKDSTSWTQIAGLTATPDPGSVFVKWTGNAYSPDCYSDQATVYVKLNAVKTCTATFDKITTDNQSLVPIKLAAYYLPGAENSGKALIRITNTNTTPMTVNGTLYHASGQLLGIANSVLIQTLAPQATVELTTTDLAKLCKAPTWTGLAWLHITTPNGLKMLNLLENDNKMISNFSTIANDNVLYNLPASTSSAQANVVLINTGDNIQSVTATLYSDSGQILGKANAVLADVAARGIFIISIKQLELLVGTTPWTDHVAKLRLTTASNTIKMMSTLLSSDATVTNLTPTHDNAVFNLPGATNLDQAFVYISNTTDSAMLVRATLYHQDGYLLGNPNTIIINNLAPQATQMLSISDVEKLFNVPTWEKRARLMITAPAVGIKVMPLIRNGSSISNLAAMTSNQVYYLPDATHADKAYIRIANTRDAAVTVTGVIYAENGQILGSGTLVSPLAAQTVAVISMPVLGDLLKVSGWTGKARLVLNPSGLQVMNTLRSSTGQLLDMSDVQE